MRNDERERERRDHLDHMPKVLQCVEPLNDSLPSYSPRTGRILVTRTSTAIKGRDAAYQQSLWSVYVTFSHHVQFPTSGSSLYSRNASPRQESVKVRQETGVPPKEEIESDPFGQRLDPRHHGRRRTHSRPFHPKGAPRPDAVDPPLPHDREATRKSRLDRPGRTETAVGREGDARRVGDVPGRERPRRRQGAPPSLLSGSKLTEADLQRPNRLAEASRRNGSLSRSRNSRSVSRKPNRTRRRRSSRQRCSQRSSRTGQKCGPRSNGKRYDALPAPGGGDGELARAERVADRSISLLSLDSSACSMWVPSLVLPVRFSSLALKYCSKRKLTCGCRRRLPLDFDHLDRPEPAIRLGPRVQLFRLSCPRAARGQVRHCRVESGHELRGQFGQPR